MGHGEVGLESGPGLSLGRWTGKGQGEWDWPEDREGAGLVNQVVTTPPCSTSTHPLITISLRK